MRRKGQTGKSLSCKTSIHIILHYFNRYRVEIIPGLSEPGIPPTPAIQPTSRIDKRKMFARSKSVKNCYSMPVPVSITNIVSIRNTFL